MTQPTQTPTATTTATRAEPQPPTSVESDAAALDRQLDMLRHLSVLGIDFCNDIHASRARPAPGTTTTRQEAADARATAQLFGSLSNTVRHTIALDASLRRGRARTARSDAAQATVTAAARLQSRRDELRCRLEPALKAAPAHRWPDLRYRLTTRLTEWDIDQDLTHHSVDAAITRICRDFNIAMPVPEPLHEGPAAFTNQGPVLQPPNCSGPVPGLALHEPP